MNKIYIGSAYIPRNIEFQYFITNTVIEYAFSKNYEHRFYNYNRLIIYKKLI